MNTPRRAYPALWKTHRRVLVGQGIVDRRTGGPKLGLDPEAKYLVPAGMPLYFTKDALGRNVIARV